MMSSPPVPQTPSPATFARAPSLSDPGGDSTPDSLSQNLQNNDYMFIIEV